MAEALDLAIRTRDRHLAFLPKPKVLVRQMVSRDLVDDGRAEDLPEEAEPDGFADLMDQIHCTLRGYQDNSGQRYQPRPRPSGYPSREKQDPICWQCRQPGHLSRDCTFNWRWLPEWLRKEMEDYRKRVESAEEGTRPVPQADQHHGPSHPSDHGPKTQSRQQDLPPGLPRQAYQATQETPRDPQLQIRVVCESAPAQPDQPAQTVTAQQTPNINNTNNQNNTPASQQVGPNHACTKRLKPHANRISSPGSLELKARSL